MTHIHDLPEEVLFNIFCKGCGELVGVWEWNSPKPRQYPVIHNVWSVCKKWKQLVEYFDQNAYNKRYFWYTNLTLVVLEDEPKSDTTKRLSEFKHSLDASQHSDIWLMCELPWDLGLSTELSEADAALFSLLIRFIDFIIPHQEQIVHFQINVEQPQILSHLLDLLMFRMKHMYRRPTIDFGLRLPPLSEILSATSISPPRLLSNPVTTMPALTYPAHIDEFELTGHNLSWLDGALMKFPFSIANLTIPPVNLLNTSSFFNAIGADLVSLTIVGEEGKTIDSYDNSDNGKFKVCITLPRLLYLEILSVCDSWAEYFLKHTKFPCLENVKLHMLPESSPSSNPPEELCLRYFGQYLNYPNLQKLQFHGFQLSQSSIFCITHFMQHTINDLEPEVNDQLESSILLPPSKFTQSEKLHIGNVHMTNWKMALATLSALDLTLLQELDIRSSESYGYVINYQEASDERNFFLAKLGSFPTKLGSFWINSPRLKSFSFQGLTPDDLLFLEIILGHINNRSLTNLQIDFSIHRGIFSGKSVFGLHARVGQLPSITSLRLLLSCHWLNDYQFLFDLLSFAPGLQQMFLEVPWNEISGPADISNIMKIFAILTTHDSQGPLLPYLESFSTKIDRSVHTGEQVYFLEQMRAIIFECLEKRHRHGAVSLGLYDLSVEGDDFRGLDDFTPSDRYGDLRIVLKHV